MLRICALFWAAIALCVICSAQIQPESKPASTNVRDAQSPRVFPDGRASFSLKAPAAKTVALAGGDGLGKGPFPMTRSDDGVWSVTLPPAVPGFHYYWFLLDGVSVNDPGSQTFMGYGKKPTASKSPSRASITTPRKMFPTETYANTGIAPPQPEIGVPATSIPRPLTTRNSPPASPS